MAETTLNHITTAFDQFDQKISEHVFALLPKEIGHVESVATGIVIVSGLQGAGFEELLKFSDDLYGIAYNLDEEEIGVILLGEESLLNAGDEVERTGRVMDIPVGDHLIGRVINPIGKAIDGKGEIRTSKRLPIERASPAILDRQAVDMPLQTGIKVIDALIPIGRGQRELIVGDRQTGKTQIAIDTIVNQKGKEVVCVYCAIGQRASAVAKVIETLEQKGAMDYTVVMVAEGNSSAGLKYIAPYAATSIAEHFMEEGQNVLIVYDDLTHHARSYRELSLLLRRPPGREAFPGDIFYIHSRLLERATHLSEHLRGGSLTALPIIETEAQNISAYIPTNLISITDGQIYLSPTLFEAGTLPAVDVGKSVSRVGSNAQSPAYKAIIDLKLQYAQFEELENFSRFGTRLDPNTRKIIDHGERIRICLKQKELHPVTLNQQIVILLALTKGLFEDVALNKIAAAESSVIDNMEQFPADLRKKLSSFQNLDDADIDIILKVAVALIAPFKKKTETDPLPS